MHKEKRKITVELTPKEFRWLSELIYEDQHSVVFDDRKHIEFIEGLLPKFGLAKYLEDWLEAEETPLRPGLIRNASGGLLNSNEPDLWVLTFVTDESDPDWETRNSVVGTPEQLGRLFDLSRLPPGARLLKGKTAARYLKQSLKEEQRYQREQLAKKQAGGMN